MRDYAELVEALRFAFEQPCYSCVLGEKCNWGDFCFFKRAADAIEELQTKVPRWISVEERLPDYEESVFVVRKFLGVKGQVPPSTYVEIAYRLGDRWVADSDEYKIARHRHTDPLYWMPLPDPPKEDKP